jgi:hypothetical protein
MPLRLDNRSSKAGFLFIEQSERKGREAWRVDRQAISIGQRRKRKLRYSLGYAWAHQDVAISYDPDAR